MLPANKSFGYQFMDPGRQTITKSLSVGKIHEASNNKKFRRLDYVNDQSYEVELVESKIEPKEPLIAVFYPAKSENRKARAFY